MLTDKIIDFELSDNVIEEKKAMKNLLFKLVPIDKEMWPTKSYKRSKTLVKSLPDFKLRMQAHYELIRTLLS